MSTKVDFFIAGVQKGGTTALDSFLRLHPFIQMARVKEVHYFDNDTDVDWSVPDYARLHEQYDWSRPAVLRGEATPIYTYWPNCLERLKAYNPDARLVVALRHPVARAYSHWKMEYKRGQEHRSYLAATSEVGRAQVRSAPGGVHRTFSYVERGFYVPQMKRLLSLFSRSQVHFLRTDSLWSRPSDALSDIEAFLGLESFLGARIKRDYIVPVDTTDFEELDPAVFTADNVQFHADIREAAVLAGLDLSDWLDSGYFELLGR